MKAALFDSLLWAVPACLIFVGSAVLYVRDKSVYSLIPLCGAGALVVFGLSQVAGALDLFPWMHWGLKHSFGEYLRFWSFVFGFTLFPVGHLFYALAKRQA